MSDEARRRLEMEATLKQIKNIQKRQSRGRGRTWRLDVPLTTLALQGAGLFAVGVLVGMGLFVLVWIAFN